MVSDMTPGMELTVKNLDVGFWTDSGLFKAVSGLSLEIRRGEVFGLVGESGSGKSCFVRSLLGLPGGDPGIISGSIVLMGKDGSDVLVDNAATYWQGEWSSGFCHRNRRKEAAWNQRLDRRFRPIRGRRISLLFQDARGSLSPYHTLREQVARNHSLNGDGVRDAYEVADGWLDSVSMYRYRHSYPHTLSGGQAQRAAIAVSMATDSSLIIADEPTTGLDASLRREIVDLMVTMAKKNGRTLLLISHDLAIVGYASDRVGVMYRGRLCEVMDDVARGVHGVHPYSRELLATIEEKMRFGNGAEAQVVRQDSTSGCVYQSR